MVVAELLDKKRRGLGGLFPCTVQACDPLGTLQGLPVLPAFQGAGGHLIRAQVIGGCKKSITCYDAHFCVQLITITSTQVPQTGERGIFYLHIKFGLDTQMNYCWLRLA